MRRMSLLALLLAVPLGAQVTDTVGGMTVPVTRVGLAKANVFRVDSSVMLFRFEMYLDIQGPENLTFFIYRHHSVGGGYTRDWTNVVPVQGTGAGWYSSGVVTFPLLAGNHYQLGVSWPGSLTYYYDRGTSGTPVSFGAWHRGTTPTGIPLVFNTAAGVDVAQYYQRIQTFPLTSVLNVGAPCTPATSARLVARSVAQVGGSLALDFVAAPASSPVLFLMAPGPAAGRPISIFGCPYWLNLAAPLLGIAQATNATGEFSLVLPIPKDPWLGGLVLTWQGGVVNLPSGVPLTNAVQFTFN